MVTITELRAIAGSDAYLLTDDELRRAHAEAQTLADEWRAKGLDPRRVVDQFHKATKAAKRRERRRERSSPRH